MDYKNVMRLCKEQIRSAKAQAEVHAATVVKDNKTCFFKYISKKLRAEEILHPLFDVGGNIFTKDVEKAEVLNAFLAPVFNSQTSCSGGTQPPELQDRDNRQDEAPAILEEMVSSLLHHIDTQRSMGLGGIHLSVLRELTEVLIEQFSVIYFLHKQTNATITS